MVSNALATDDSEVMSHSTVKTLSGDSELNVLLSTDLRRSASNGA